MTASAGHPDIAALIAGGALRSVYQPIISLNQGKVIGFEALARGYSTAGEALNPEQLFQAADRQDLSLELDRLCRRRAIEGFRQSPAFDSDALVFVNLDTSILTEKTVGSNQIKNLILEQGLSPERVVIEILESRITDDNAIRRFIDNHRRQGFLIALDDMGSGHSNLERIPTMRPDIIKIDRSLISGIERDYQKQELFDFFIKLSGRIGAAVIAEGVETEAEAFACLERGADLFQGYHFAKPGPIDIETAALGADRALKAKAAYRVHEQRILELRSQQESSYEEIATAFCKQMRSCQAEEYDRALEASIEHHPEVECAYVLDERGIQISSTIFSARAPRCVGSPLYAPAKPGYDLSMRDYFLSINEWCTRFITTPYRSRASGSLCITISSSIVDGCGQKRILCLDINPKADIEGI